MSSFDESFHKKVKKNQVLPFYGSPVRPFSKKSESATTITIEQKEKIQDELVKKRDIEIITFFLKQLKLSKYLEKFTSKNITFEKLSKLKDREWDKLIPIKKDRDRLKKEVVLSSNERCCFNLLFRLGLSSYYSNFLLENLGTSNVIDISESIVQRCIPVRADRRRFLYFQRRMRITAFVNSSCDMVKNDGNLSGVVKENIVDLLGNMKWNNVVNEAKILLTHTNPEVVQMGFVLKQMDVTDEDYLQLQIINISSNEIVATKPFMKVERSGFKWEFRRMRPYDGEGKNFLRVIIIFLIFLVIFLIIGCLSPFFLFIPMWGYIVMWILIFISISMCIFLIFGVVGLSFMSILSPHMKCDTDEYVMSLIRPWERARPGGDGPEMELGLLYKQRVALDKKTKEKTEGIRGWEIVELSKEELSDREAELVQEEESIRESTERERNSYRETTLIIEKKSKDKFIVKEGNPVIESLRLMREEKRRILNGTKEPPRRKKDVNDDVDVKLKKEPREKESRVREKEERREEAIEISERERRNIDRNPYIM